MNGRRALAVGVVLVVALTQTLRVGTYLSGNWFTLYYSFFGDVAVPVGTYFLLCASDVNLRVLRGWPTKVLLVFAMAATAEIAQGLGMPFLGSTFDPLDFVMYALGALLAAFLDRVVLSRAFSFWAVAG